MNERIKELAEECWNKRPEGQLHFDNEKFAQLIVKESIKVMMENDYHGEWLGEKLKEHFGFEE
jgi:hypothetical protein